MKTVINSARLGIIAAAMSLGLALPAVAAPTYVPAPAVPAKSADVAVTPVQWKCANGPYCRNSKTGELRTRNQVKNGGAAQWNNGPRWKGDDRRYWRDRRHNDWRWRDRPRSGVGIYLDLGVPSYRYVEPRRSYRGVTAAHIDWCYARWRSYRASDNTYQPTRGPRRQCISPYS